MSHLQIDDPITFKFNCTFEFPKSPGVPPQFLLQNHRFYTIHDCYSYRHSILIHQGKFENAKSANDFDWEIEIKTNFPEGTRETVVSMVVFDQDGDEIVSEAHLTMIFEPRQPIRFVPDVPLDRHPITAALARCHHLDGVTWCRVDLCVRFTVPASFFAFLPYFRSLIPPPPEMEDYRFAPLTDRSRHDVLIHCRDGTISASREALFRVAEIFRTWPREMVENTSCQAVHELLCFMMTETWSHPGEMTRKHATELIELIGKYKPLQFMDLFDAIQNHLLWQLYENRYNLRQVLNIFVVAYPQPKYFVRLGWMAAAMIYHLHRNEYMLKFAEATAANRPDHELIAALHAPEQPGSTMHVRLLEIFYETSHVQLIIDNKTPPGN